MAEITYYYAAYSSYTYLGSRRFMAIAAAAGRTIVHRPVDLDRVLQGAGSSSFSERSIAFRSYFFRRELERWAEYRGVRTLGRRPTHHAGTPHLANRMLIAAADEGRGIDALAHRFLEAHWAEDANPYDEATLIALTAGQGYDGEALLARAKGAAVAEQYEANTCEAIERSVFGAPTYVVDGDLFYGQDRLELVERALASPFADTWPPVSG